jgi:nucleoside-diphosphate-sugar epimerase
MRVFLTGATGYVGGAVAAALRTAGHEVGALVRPNANTAALHELGVMLIQGDLAALPRLSEDGALDGFDAFVHAAQSPSDSATLNQTAVDSFLGRDAYLLYTSGIWVLGNGKADEHTPARSLPIVAWRPAQEQQVLSSGRHAVIRPGCVYGGRQSLFAGWFAAAAEKKPIEIIGDGSNHWALINLHDLAACYLRIVESRASGIFHAVDDSRLTLDEAARVIAPQGAISHIPPDAVRAQMGPFTDALLIDQEISSDLTRQHLGWKPTRDFVGSIDEQWEEFTRK